METKIVAVVKHKTEAGRMIVFSSDVRSPIVRECLSFIVASWTAGGALEFMTLVDNNPFAENTLPSSASYNAAYLAEKHWKDITAGLKRVA